jgi:hypothetical protein
MDEPHTTPARRFLTASGLALALLVVVLTMPRPGSATPAARLAGIQGAGSSAILVQNRDLGGQARLLADFRSNTRAGELATISPKPIAPGATHLLWLNSEDVLKPDDYAVRLQAFEAERSLAAVAWVSWGLSHSAVMFNSTAASSPQILPLVVHGFRGENSAMIAVQNSDLEQPAEVEIEFHDSESSRPIERMQLSIEAGGTGWVNYGFGPVPGGLALGSSGWARINSAIPVAVTSIVDLEDSDIGSYATSGIPAEMAADRLFAPVIHASAPQDPQDAGSTRLDSEIVIIVPGEEPVELNLDFVGILGDCAGQRYAQGPIAVAAGGQVRISQAPGAGGALPDGCTATATIGSEGGKILASVVDRSQGPRAGVMAQGYDAFAIGQAAETVLVPLFRQRHTDFELTTALHVMNTGDADADVHVEFIDWDGSPLRCGASCDASIPVGGGRMWWPPDIQGIARGAFGRAVVTADQPVVVIAIDASLSGDLDLVSFAGIPSAQPAAPAVPSAPEFIPSIQKSGLDVRIPAATLPATPLHAARATPSPGRGRSR